MPAAASTLRPAIASPLPGTELQRRLVEVQLRAGERERADDRQAGERGGQRAAVDEPRPAAPAAVLGVAAVDPAAGEQRHAVDARRRARRGSPGSSVIAASADIAGISIPARPIERMNGSGRSTSESRPIATVEPEITHRAARVGHRLGQRGLDVRALAQLGAEAHDHQQRVVDRHAEPDERDQELHDDRDVGGVGQRPHERERVQDRGDRDRDRDQHGGQRAEDEEQDHDRADGADRDLGDRRSSRRCRRACWPRRAGRGRSR